MLLACHVTLDWGKYLFWAPYSGVFCPCCLLLLPWLETLFTTACRTGHKSTRWNAGTPIWQMCVLLNNDKLKLSKNLVFRRKMLWVTAATVTTWFSSELCWAGGGFSKRATEWTGMNIWTNTVCQSPACDLSMVCSNYLHTHQVPIPSEHGSQFSFLLSQVSSCSSAPTCTKLSWCLTPASVSKVILSAITTATRKSCWGLCCWLDSFQTSFRYVASSEQLWFCGIGTSKSTSVRQTHTLPFVCQIKKGVVNKGGRFQPNHVAFRTLSGQVHLHRSTVNRCECAPLLLQMVVLLPTLHGLCLKLFIHFVEKNRTFPAAGWPSSVP